MATLRRARVLQRRAGGNDGGGPRVYVSSRMAGPALSVLWRASEVRRIGGCRKVAELVLANLRHQLHKLCTYVWGSCVRLPEREEWRCQAVPVFSQGGGVSFRLSERRQCSELWLAVVQCWPSMVRLPHHCTQDHSFQCRCSLYKETVCHMTLCLCYVWGS